MARASCLGRRGVRPPGEWPSASRSLAFSLRVSQTRHRSARRSRTSLAHLLHVRVSCWNVGGGSGRSGVYSAAKRHGSAGTANRWPWSVAQTARYRNCVARRPEAVRTSGKAAATHHSIIGACALGASAKSEMKSERSTPMIAVATSAWDAAWAFQPFKSRAIVASAPRKMAAPRPPPYFPSARAFFSA